jgi:hypothetical protein
MDQELIAYLDGRFRETSEQIESFREETSRRFEQVETAIRHTQVSVEGLRGEVRLVAEGVMSFDERLPVFRKDFEQELENIRGSIRSSYATLDRRTFALESWRERKERDPIDLIREKYGKTPG